MAATTTTTTSTTPAAATAPFPPPPPASSRSGLQSRKSCFKPSGREGLRVLGGVSFSSEARCLETGTVVQPHPRDHVQWAEETRLERLVAVGLAELLEEQAAWEAAWEAFVVGQPAPMVLCPAYRADLRERLKEAKRNSDTAATEAGCLGRKSRHLHPALWRPYGGERT